ncbi:hypothetical protein BDW71DRAFT_207815 [Aspergillus fruticulosus]
MEITPPPGKLLLDDGMFRRPNQSFVFLFFLKPIRKSGRSSVPFIYTRVQDELKEGKKRYRATWKTNRDILITRNDSAIHLLHYLSASYILTADNTSSGADQLLYVYLDGKANYFAHGRIETTKESAG